MTLRRALESLPRDRENDAALREVLTLLRRHAGEWVERRRVVRIIEEHPGGCPSILETLVSSFVLDFDADGERYRMPSDRFLFLEIDAFLRAAGGQSEALQANVAKFRHMYGTR